MFFLRITARFIRFDMPNAQIEVKGSFELGEFRELTETIGQSLQDVVEKYLRR